LGWFAGMAAGTAMAASQGLKSSIYPLHFAGHVYSIYAALPALALNLLVAGIASMVSTGADLVPGGENQ
jgi:solute:Na+ symporter, SSS family